MEDNIVVAETNLTSPSSSSSPSIASSNHDDGSTMKNEIVDDGAVVVRRDEHQGKNDNKMPSMVKKNKKETKLAAVDAIFAAGTFLLAYACMLCLLAHVLKLRHLRVIYQTTRREEMQLY